MPYSCHDKLSVQNKKAQLPLLTGSCACPIMVEAAGIEPVEVKSAETTPTPHHATKPLQNNTLQPLPISPKPPDSTTLRQNYNDSQQQICVPGVYENSPPKDLAHVMAC
jgi:hypothetical protein